MQCLRARLRQFLFGCAGVIVSPHHRAGRTGVDSSSPAAARVAWEEAGILKRGEREIIL